MQNQICRSIVTHVLMSEHTSTSACLSDLCISLSSKACICVQAAASTAAPSQPASSDLSEIQPASTRDDTSGQTVFAAPYKNTAISKLMSQTKGPSTTVPPTETSQSVQNLAPQSQYPEATISGPQATVSETAPTSERVQTVSGFETKSPQGQNMNTGGFRSSSGVPSEDELAQLYSNDAEAAQVPDSQQLLHMPA